MGQAKQRGTYEERKAQAIERNAQAKLQNTESPRAGILSVIRSGNRTAAKFLAIAGLAGGFSLLGNGRR